MVAVETNKCSVYFTVHKILKESVYTMVYMEPYMMFFLLMPLTMYYGIFAMLCEAKFNTVHEYHLLTVCNTP